MSTKGVVIAAFGMTMAILLIVGTLLGRAGVSSVISRRLVNQPPAIVRVNLLLGVSMVLLFGSQMIPVEHRQAWASVLLPLALCLSGAGALQWLITLRKH